MEELLKKLRKYNRNRNITMSLKIYPDGSGELIDMEGSEIVYFENYKELIKVLDSNIVNEINSKEAIASRLISLCSKLENTDIKKYKSAIRSINKAIDKLDKL